MVDENCDRRNTNQSKIILSLEKKQPLEKTPMS